MNKNTLIGSLLVLIVVALAVFSIVKFWPGSSTATPVATVTYSCEAARSIVATYREDKSKEKPGTADQLPVPGGMVSLELSDGRKLDLDQTISASGVRYSNPDESFVFWNKGNGALVLENDQEKTYIGCIRVADDPSGLDSRVLPLPAVYSNNAAGFSLRLPSLAMVTPDVATPDAARYSVDEGYSYRLSPEKVIYGLKFTIPGSMATGTNLSHDSYISVEQIPQTENCTADLFFDGIHQPETKTDHGTEYSVATSSGAGAGNRYEETVYALPGTNPCIAIRYLVHYSVFENYPEGSINHFDQQALLSEFDAIRRTLVVNQ